MLSLARLVHIFPRGLLWQKKQKSKHKKLNLRKQNPKKSLSKRRLPLSPRRSALPVPSARVLRPPPPRSLLHLVILWKNVSPPSPLSSRSRSRMVLSRRSRMPRTTPRSRLHLRSLLLSNQILEFVLNSSHKGAFFVPLQNFVLAVHVNHGGFPRLGLGFAHGSVCHDNHQVAGLY